MPIRPVIVFPALVFALFAAAAPAGASAAGPAQLARAGGAAGQIPGPPAFRMDAVRAAANPAGSIFDDTLSGVSCSTMPDSPAIKSMCSAVGFAVVTGSVIGLNEDATNGKWLSAPVFGGVGNGASLPVSVSCAAQALNIPVCLAVGEYEVRAKHPVQLIAPGDWNGFGANPARNPAGATWSEFSYVSCPAGDFCMLVGADGTTRRTSHGLAYISHANVYRWNGRKATRVKIPAPLKARQAELAGVSCPTTTSCMAVGNATTARGRWLPFSALWTKGRWRIQRVPAVSRKAAETLQSVSCAAAGECVVVGDVTRRHSTVFAERYARGKWSPMGIAGRYRSAFYDVTCPATTYCVAVGVQHGHSALIEAWKRRRWGVQAVPAMRRPLNVSMLFSVSCVSPSDCTAVGIRHNPKIRYSYRTLATGWNGTSWKLERTFNQ